jgi:RNA recognition motif-containing protein
MTKLFVGSLPFSMIDERLLDLFTEKGYSPISARVINDFETGRSRGFGFVELERGADAARAIGEFDGLSIEGRMLHVSEAPTRIPERRSIGASGTTKILVSQTRTSLHYDRVSRLKSRLTPIVAN